jgi:hypothetical protein
MVNDDEECSAPMELAQISESAIFVVGLQDAKLSFRASAPLGTFPSKPHA